MAYARVGFRHSWHHVRHWYIKCVLVNATEINMETNVDNRRRTVAAAQDTLLYTFMHASCERQK